MIQFPCSYQWGEDDYDDWEGSIEQITDLGGHYEIVISSRSRIRLLVGRSTTGLFACLPDDDAGCHLSTLADSFYNSERLIYAMENPVDGITVACALKALSHILSFQ